MRELDHVIERAVLMSTGNIVTAFDSRSKRLPTRASARLEEMSLEDAERLLIKKALARFEGNANRAAEALGLSRSALYRRPKIRPRFLATKGTKVKRIAQ